MLTPKPNPGEGNREEVEFENIVFCSRAEDENEDRDGEWEGDKFV
jgi:hypothetical protein